MKKILFAFIALVTITSCGVKMTGYDFEKTIVDDKLLVETLSGANAIQFCEAQARFVKNFNKEDNKFEVSWVMTVFQVDSLVYTITHPENEYDSEPVVVKYQDIWLGDLYSPIEVNVTLKNAIENIKDSDIEVPATPFVVLRRPIVKPPFPEYKYYIFGSSQKGAIKVDSNSGEVTNL